MEVLEISPSEITVMHEGTKIRFEKSSEVLDNHEHYSQTFLMIGFVGEEIKYISEGDFMNGSDDFVQLAQIEEVDPLDIEHYKKII